MFLAEILSPHLVSSSGSGGGGVLGLRSNNGFFGFITDWSTVPDASAANILKRNTTWEVRSLVVVKFCSSSNSNSIIYQFALHLLYY